MSDFVKNANTVLIIGATSGIGKALALKFHSDGKKVIHSGRRQQNLDEISAQLKNERVETVQWDITDLQGIKPKASEIIHKYGDTLNTVLIVSGVQRTTDFTQPEKLDFPNVDLEIKTNFTSYIHLIATFLPFLSTTAAAKNPWIGVVSSSLALLPMPRTPVYNGTKAALHQMILSIRAQLDSAGSPVQLVEIYPPSVKTELHDKKHQSDLEDDYPGMELDDFVNETWDGLTSGKHDIPAGPAKEQWEKIDKPRQELLQASLKKK